jgi:serine protease Do
MRNILSALVLFVMTAALTACGNNDGINYSVLDAKNGVLMIVSSTDPSNSQSKGGLGTGFFIGENVIITNEHVVKGAKEIIVSIENGVETYEAEIVNHDPVSDLAIIRIKDWDKFKRNNQYKVLKLSDTPVTETEEVYAVGNPWGILFSVSKGIVSGIEKKSDKSPKYMIQTDAHVYQGNSGGPLLDTHGEVIGVNSLMMANEGGSYGFALPVPLIKKVLSDFEKYEGVTRWPYLGIVLNINKVEKLSPGMPAEKVGIEPGDIILVFTTSEGSFDPKFKSLPVAMATHDPEKSVIVVVSRDGKELSFEIKPEWKDATSLMSP